MPHATHPPEASRRHRTNLGDATRPQRRHSAVYAPPDRDSETLSELGSALGVMRPLPHLQTLPSISEEQPAPAVSAGVPCVICKVRQACLIHGKPHPTCGRGSCDNTLSTEQKRFILRKDMESAPCAESSQARAPSASNAQMVPRPGRKSVQALDADADRRNRRHSRDLQSSAHRPNSFHQNQLPPQQPSQFVNTDHPRRHSRDLQNTDRPSSFHQGQLPPQVPPQSSNTRPLCTNCKSKPTILQHGLRYSICSRQCAYEMKLCVMCAYNPRHVYEGTGHISRTCGRRCREYLEAAGGVLCNLCDLKPAKPEFWPQCSSDCVDKASRRSHRLSMTDAQGSGSGNRTESKHVPKLTDRTNVGNASAEAQSQYAMDQSTTLPQHSSTSVERASRRSRCLSVPTDVQGSRSGTSTQHNRVPKLTDRTNVAMNASAEGPSRHALAKSATIAKSSKSPIAEHSTEEIIGRLATILKEIASMSSKEMSDAQGSGSGNSTKHDHVSKLADRTKVDMKASAEGRHASAKSTTIAKSTKSPIAEASAEEIVGHQVTILKDVALMPSTEITKIKTRDAACLICWEKPLVRRNDYWSCESECLDMTRRLGSPALVEAPRGHGLYKIYAGSFADVWGPSDNKTTIDHVYVYLPSERMRKQHEEYKSSLFGQKSSTKSTEYVPAKQRHYWIVLTRECDVGDSGVTTFCSSTTCQFCVVALYGWETQIVHDNPKGFKVSISSFNANRDFVKSATTASRSTQKSSRVSKVMCLVSVVHINDLPEVKLNSGESIGATMAPYRHDALAVLENEEVEGWQMTGDVIVRKGRAVMPLAAIVYTTRS